MSVRPADRLLPREARQARAAPEVRAAQAGPDGLHARDSGAEAGIARRPVRARWRKAGRASQELMADRWPRKTSEAIATPEDGAHERCGSARTFLASLRGRRRVRTPPDPSLARRSGRLGFDGPAIRGDYPGCIDNKVMSEGPTADALERMDIEAGSSLRPGDPSSSGNRWSRPMPSASRLRLITVVGLMAVLAGPSRARGQGVIAPGAGPINRSMAGASTAAPVDFGSSYWNPATISGLDRQEFLLGLGADLPQHPPPDVPAGRARSTACSRRRALGHVAERQRRRPRTWPRARRSGSTTIRPGPSAWASSAWSAAAVNYAGSNPTPLLLASSTAAIVRVRADLREPRRSSRSRRWPRTGRRTGSPSAAGPSSRRDRRRFTPAFFAPGPKDQFGLPTFPAATNSRPFWGAGSSSACSINVNENWNLGFSYKSPIWQERWGVQRGDPRRYRPRRIGVQAQIPAIYLLGRRLQGAAEDPDRRRPPLLRLRQHRRSSARASADGGLGWRSVFAVATGAQYQLTDRVTLRGGYLFNTNPIPSTGTLFNVQAPGITQHTLSLGVVDEDDRRHHRHRRLGPRIPQLDRRAASSRSPAPRPGSTSRPTRSSSA